MREPLYDRVAVPLYLTMGWLCLGWSMPLYQTVGTAPILLMIAGAISYTVGLLFYRERDLAYSNPMWHLCVVAGSTAFFVAIIHLLRA